MKKAIPVQLNGISRRLPYDNKHLTQHSERPAKKVKKIPVRLTGITRRTTCKERDPILQPGRLEHS